MADFVPFPDAIIYDSELIWANIANSEQGLYLYFIFIIFILPYFFTTPNIWYVKETSQGAQALRERKLLLQRKHQPTSKYNIINLIFSIFTVNYFIYYYYYYYY